jgi:hypothetical protein
MEAATSAIWLAAPFAVAVLGVLFQTADGPPRIKGPIDGRRLGDSFLLHDLEGQAGRARATSGLGDVGDHS